MFFIQKNGLTMHHPNGAAQPYLLTHIEWHFRAPNGKWHFAKWISIQIASLKFINVCFSDLVIKKRTSHHDEKKLLYRLGRVQHQHQHHRQQRRWIRIRFFGRWNNSRVSRVGAQYWWEILCNGNADGLLRQKVSHRLILFALDIMQSVVRSLL